MSRKQKISAYKRKIEGLIDGSDPFGPGHFIAEPTPTSRNRLAYENKDAGIYLFHANCLEMMDSMIAKFPQGRFDMIFVDPPYFLSNGGITCHGGNMVKVDKGDWDKSRGTELNHEFNYEWLKRCQRLLKPNGTIWVTGTMHSIFSVGFALQQLEFKVLNDVIWEKPNPAPNLTRRYFVHSTETLIWAAKNQKSRYVFNHDLMKAINDKKQMKSVWKLSPPGPAEKRFGKHPTQKPVSLVDRCINAATNAGDFVLDPFCGSSTTGVAAILNDRKFCGIDSEAKFINLSIQRIEYALRSAL